MANDNTVNLKKENLILVNAVEEIVKEKAKDLIKKAGMCSCQKCYLDVCAIALNNVKPLYITTNQGRMLSSLSILDYGYQASLMVEITKAIEKVKAKPNH